MKELTAEQQLIISRLNQAKQDAQGRKRMVVPVGDIIRARRMGNSGISARESLEKLKVRIIESS